MLPLEIVHCWFGFDSFRGCQLPAIEAVMRGEDTLVIAPTGSGKSLCYQIPALSDDLPGDLVVVLSPLIALMQDQVESLTKRGISATYVNSSLSPDERRKRYAELAAGEHRLLYVTPERFRKVPFLEAIANRQIKLLAVDEAHCVSQWGHDFRPDYSRIADIRKRLGNPTTIALTATATQECQYDIAKQLGLSLDRMQRFHEGIERPNLELQVEEVYGDADKLDRIQSLLEDSSYKSGSRIIYFSLIKTLERFSDRLRQLQIRHLKYHGDLDRKERRRIQNIFMREPSCIVLATNAFGMGIDKENIRLVVHAETPSSIESYYQEVGRAGRDGLPSLCLWLYDQGDLMTQMQFIDWRNPDADYYGRLLHFLTERGEECRAFGLEWLNDKLQKVSRHDHRLQTAIAMLDRQGIVKGPQPPDCFILTGKSPARFTSDRFLAEKKKRDQQRLLSLVQLARCDSDRKEFLHNYFMGPQEQPVAPE